MQRPSRRDVLVSALGAMLGFACQRREPPPELGKLPAFSLTNEQGKDFGSKELTGRVWAAAFFFTRCPTVCPVLTANMRKLQERAKADDLALQLVSFSVDPEHDTPFVLREFARKHGADLTSWTFLTGNPDVIEKTAEKGFKLALDGKADPSAEHFGLLHGSHFVLVDRALTIRGYYPSDDEAQRANLLADARTLLG